MKKQTKGYFLLADRIRGRRLKESMIPAVCSLDSMLYNLTTLHGDYDKLKPWEKRCYQNYNIDSIKRKIISADSSEWKGIIREHLLLMIGSEIGASVADIYLVALVNQRYGEGKDTFFDHIFEAKIADTQNSANAIWTVGKGDGLYLGILNKDGSVADWEFMHAWVKQNDMIH